MNIRIKAAKAREDILAFLETKPEGVTVHEICKALGLKRIRTGKRMVDFRALNQVEYYGNSPHGVWALPKYKNTALDYLTRKALATKEARKDRATEKRQAAIRAKGKKPRPERPSAGDLPFTQIIVSAKEKPLKEIPLISSVFDLGKLHSQNEKREGAFAHPSQTSSATPSTTLED